MVSADVVALLTGDALSVLGSYFLIVAVAALTYAVSHSVALMGLQFGATALLRAVAAPWCGILADRVRDRRVVMIGADLFRAAMVLGLARAHTGWQVVALAAATAVGTSAFFSARGALLVEVVGRERIARFNGVRNVIAGAARLLGPLLAGIVAARFGFGVAFACNAAGYLASAAATAVVRPRYRATVDAPRRPAYGVVRGDPELLRTIIIRAWAQFGQWAMNATVLVWILAVPFGGTSVLGAAIAVYEAGSMVIGGMLLRVRRPVRASWLLAAAAVGALAWCTYPFVHSTPALLALQVPEGVCSWALAILAVTMIQQRAPEAVLGSVLAVEDQVDAVGNVAGNAAAAGLSALVAPPVAFPVLAGLAAIGYGVCRAVTAAPERSLWARHMPRPARQGSGVPARENPDGGRAP